MPTEVYLKLSTSMPCIALRYKAAGPPSDLREAFEEFVSKVEAKGNWVVRPNKNATSPLGLAYYTFLKVANKCPYKYGH